MNQRFHLRAAIRNGVFDPYDKNGKLLSNFIPKDVFYSQNRRVYGDEIPLPDEDYCWNKCYELCERTEWWTWTAAIRWNNLRLECRLNKIKKSRNYLTH